MQRKKQNQFDSLVENLVQEFTKIPNFDLTQTDEIANKLFNKITFRISDITAYKDLVCSHFIPATNKAIFNSKMDFQKSQYKHYLKTDNIDFKETLHDTIRLSYVGLFHKLENYVNDIVQMANLILDDNENSKISIEKWAKDEFDFSLKNWRQFKTTFKINWIANCVKHKDGFPIKEPIPEEYSNIDKSMRIELTKEEFKNDCEALIKLYPMFLQIFFIIAQHKSGFEEPINEEDYKYSPELYQKQIENKNKVELKIRAFISLLQTRL